VKKALSVLAVLAVLATSALAQFSKYRDWEKSPEAYFLTPGERAEWKKVSTDEDAEKFIALYWAKRGGEPFKQEVSRRIAAADQQFKLQRYKRGADSVRGRLLVTLGPPSRVSQQRTQENVSGQADAGRDAAFSGGEEVIVHTWTYEKEKLAPFGLPELRAQISVDPRRGSDTLQNSTEVERAIAVIAEKSIVNPNATPATAAPAPAAGAPKAPLSSAPPSASAPAAAPAPAAAAAPAPAAAAAPAPVALPAAVKSALQEAAGKTGEAAFWSGTFRSAGGDPFLALQFYLPSDKPIFASAAPLKFAGIVTDDAGKEVASIWEDATFSEITEGARKDRVLDRSVPLPPGSYKGSFGLFAAEGQPPLSSTTISFKLDPKSAEFEVSPLILSNGLLPLTKRPGPTDPFVFGSEKPIKVEPKGDHLFSKQDSLWYFYEVANPTLPAAAPEAGAAPAPATTPGPGTSAAPVPTTEAPRPRIMTRINVQRDGKDAFAPFTGPAEMQPLAPGYYASGSEIPLTSFDPGYYTFMISVRDLNAPRGSVGNKGVERKEEFVVLMPDGSLPPKAKPAAAPTPKPKKP
jgi:GWxTD domain-containing protein